MAARANKQHDVRGASLARIAQRAQARSEEIFAAGDLVVARALSEFGKIILAEAKAVRRLR